MFFKSLIFFWLFSVPVLTVDSAISTLFVIRQDTDELGGCASYLPSPLETWLSESKALVNSGLQALADAQNPSAAEYNVARRYLLSYFGASDDPDAVALVKGEISGHRATFANQTSDYIAEYLKEVKDFLDGTSTLDEIPHLYCNDTWLRKLDRFDVAWNKQGEDIMKVSPDGSMAPMAIEEVPRYEQYLWEEKNGLLVRNNKNVPYWSDELSEYVFDQNYGGKTYCTKSKTNLAAAQEQTSASTVTLCPSSFTNPKGVDGLGSATPRTGLSIMKVLPRSATLYHELFHLILGQGDTPDITYSWTQQRTMLDKKPTAIPDGYDMTYEQLIRRNPETYVFFSVGYWYFQQTQWSINANERWSFHSGAAELVAI
ncbi:hypothetical protein DTO164E3_4709 [Paecilomyces variotii]|nr:hypothetical protein DTO032I3_7500 [Paecilomyces variotii]KAJ9199397.1 hypothetical protein DTO164E3_4709 [Paecilomyces variotii]KAJ9278351.1 hypothetical protein DTO021D3_4830 [Paecilomyces variotii]KAJ9339697.1 hypothetical protein DTO027B6_7722 [Paecilomyces variotii]KAJ9382281.1 hypothetical protein DTO032I4_5768 [Paecilomyces variotii]